MTVLKERAAKPSVLFVDPTALEAVDEQPEFFKDLHLDEILDVILAGYEEYGLRPLFYQPLGDVDAVRYRHEVFRDLQDAGIREAVDAFTAALRDMRNAFAMSEKLSYPQQKQRWFLDAALIYCDAVASLECRFSRMPLGSRGLQVLADYLQGYVASPAFTRLARDARSVSDALAGVLYAVHIKGSQVRVQRYAGEPEYSAEVTETFARFQQRTGADYRVTFSESAYMDHVEARIADLVAALYPAEFTALATFTEVHADFLDPVVAAFDRDIHFYLAYLRHVERLTRGGLPFCYPELSTTSKETMVRGGYDLALTMTRDGEPGAIVGNDFSLDGGERVIVVTGPNSGGKTTFARMFGQVHYLASLGLPVPARAARLFLPDRVFTHFEREEQLATLRGKLDDELVRLRDILAHATARSVIVMNESFSSTALRDARHLGAEILRRVLGLDAIGVYVTFVDELASIDGRIVSMVGSVDPRHPARRTYRFERRPADGRAYALAVAAKYGLTYEQLRRRVAS